VVDKTCALCGKPLTGRQKVFCSRDCSMTFEASKRNDVICKTCGKEFNLCPSRATRSKTGPFCSFECKTKVQELEIDPKWLEDQYITHRRYIKDIANELGCSFTAVQKAMIRAGIPRRPRSYHHIGRKHTREEKRKIAISKIGKPRSLDVRQKLSVARTGKYKGPESPTWKGGKSFEPYCFRFNCILKEEVRNAFDRTCFLCGTPENGRKLAVHHVDYNKSQGCKGLNWSLIPLCQTCHTKTNFDRWHWFAMLRDYWIYDHIDFDSMGLKID
jgi:endogenous inhibitor of DNA gyrase (YacG/DUF329 family)